MSSRPENNLTEKDLLEHVKDGDTSAIRQLYEQYAGYLTAVCSRYVTDSEKVKDILQEAFIKIFDKIKGFDYRGDGSLRAWMTRIVVNDSLKSLRHAGRLTYVEDLPDVEDESDASPAGIPAAVIQDMIRSLPDGYRTILNLYVFENLPHRDIAAMLGIKEDSSASQLSRARAILSKKIKEYRREHDNV